MCKVLKVSRSGYYKWLDRPLSKRAQRRLNLTVCIRKIFVESRRLYGSPKITAVLRNKGYTISEKTVSRIMRQEKMVSRTIRKYLATTNSKHNMPVSPNILKQQFTACEPGKVLMSDITYIKTKEGWLYLASVEDLYSREIIGWSADDRMTTSLTLTALNRAVSKYPLADDVIHHSDRGSQYAARNYQSRLSELGITGSMSRKGNCYDNGCIESFHSIIKREEIYLEDYTKLTREEAKIKIFKYIECFYNCKRVHSSIGYHTPRGFTELYLSKVA